MLPELHGARRGQGSYTAAAEQLPIDHLADLMALAKGQIPVAAFVDCLDSRVAVDLILDCRLGSAFSANVAGIVVSPDVLGSLEYAGKVAGSKVVVVLGHTSYGAVKGAGDGVKLGNLAGLHAKIQPAIDAMPDDGTPRSSKYKAVTTKVARKTVELQVERICKESPVLRELEAQGKIKIVGAIYDVEMGLCEFL